MRKTKGRDRNKPTRGKRQFHPLRRIVGTVPNWFRTSTGHWDYTDGHGIEILECGHWTQRREDRHGPTNASFRRCWRCTKRLVRWPCLDKLEDIQPIIPPPPPPPKPRVICFIDGGNTYQAFRAAFGTGKYNQDRLCHLLAGEERDLIEWRFYIAEMPEGISPERDAEHEAQKTFLDVIRAKEKCVLCLGRFQVNGGGHLREKGVDVRLAVDLVRLAAEDKYDIAIVLSCDEDLLHAVDTVQQIYEKTVELAIPEGAKAFHMKWISEKVQRIKPELFSRVRIG